MSRTRTWKKVSGFAQGFEPGNYNYKNGATAPEVTGNAIGALPNLKRPYFLYAHYMDAHSPYTPPDAFQSLRSAPETTSHDSLLNNSMKFMEYYQDCVYVDMLGLRAEATVRPLAGRQGRRGTFSDAEIRLWTAKLNG